MEQEEASIVGSAALGDEEKDESGADRTKCPSVTFISGLSKEELDKPKLQRIPTPYYEHLQQAGAAGVMGDAEGRKGTPGGTEGVAVPSNPEPPAQTEEGPSSGGPVDDFGGQPSQAGPPPAKSASSTGRRMHREFSMSRDD